MNKLLSILFLAALALLCCQCTTSRELRQAQKGAKDIPFVTLENYYVRNDVDCSKTQHLIIDNETDFKEFAKTCKKNGVDFAIVKDAVDDNVIHFFFAGKNAEVMSHLFEEYAKEKYQQDIKNEMLPDQEEREHEKAEMELDAKEQSEKEFEPKSKKAKIQKEEADIEKKVNIINESIEKETEKMAEKTNDLLDETLDDIEIPEMER